MNEHMCADWYVRVSVGSGGWLDESIWVSICMFVGPGW